MSTEFIKTKIKNSFLICVFFIFALFSTELFSLTLTVTNNSDFLPGSLRDAMHQANANPGSTIVINPSLMGGQTIILDSPLPMITQDMTIQGPATGIVTIDGNALNHVFFVASGTVSISHLTVQNGLAQGGKGGNATAVNSNAGSGAGGGALGAGGGLFIHQGAHVSVSNMVFKNNSAVGGDGGTLYTAITGMGGAGGGGGLGGGAGGDAAKLPFRGGAGGGGGFVGGSGGQTLIDNFDGASGGDVYGAAGGQGGPGAPPSGGGGGGGASYSAPGESGKPAIPTIAGLGGAGVGAGGGGGGGAQTTDAGKLMAGQGGEGGPLGGGGGGGGGAVNSGGSSVTAGSGGPGGFGGGGGGGGAARVLGGTGIPTPGSGGTGGFGAGEGTQGGPSATMPSSYVGGGGGGGAAFGGGIFVADGATFSMEDTIIEDNWARGGTGGNAFLTGSDGIGLGHDLFIKSGAFVTFHVSEEQKIPTIIESDQGAGGGVGGGVLKTGPGTLYLSGANTYTGGTTIAEGRLTVNGSILGTVTIQPGAILSGNATIQTAILNPGHVLNSGRMSPGNSIGTIHIGGNYTQTLSGILSIELSPNASDVVNVGGVAFLDGLVEFTPDPGVYSGQEIYTFLNAGSISGTFENAVFATNPGGIFSGKLFYGSDFVQLMLSVDPNFIDLVQGGNAGTLAEYFSAVNASACADLGEVFTVLRSLDEEALHKAFDHLQPSQFGGMEITQEEVSVLVRSAFSRRTSDLHSTGCKEMADHRFNFWVDGFHQHINQHHYREQTGFKADANGAVAGVDMEVFKNFYLGAAGSYTHAHLRWNDSFGSGNVNTWYGGLYASWLSHAFFVDAAVFGARNDYEAHRHIKFSTIERKAKSEFDGYEVFGTLSGGWSWHLHQFLLQPYILFDYDFLHEDGFSEHGASCLDLQVKNKEANFLRTELGMNFAYCWNFNHGKLVPEITLAYVRESRFNDKHYKAALVGFEDANGFFTVSSQVPSRNLFAPAVNLTGFFLNDRLTLKAAYGASIGQGFWQQEASGQIGWSF